MSVLARISAVLKGLLLSVLLVACSTVSQQPPMPKSVSAPDYVPDAGYHMLMGEIAMQRGDYYITAQEYLAAAQISDDAQMAQRATEYSYEYGYVAYMFSAARRWVQLDPESTLASGYLGMAYLGKKNAGQAFKYFEKSMPAVGQRSEGDYLVLESEMAVAGKYATSVEVLEKFLQRYPAQPGAHLALANAAMRSGDGALAVKNADAVLVQEPGLRQAQIVRLRGLMISGEVERSLEEMRDLIAAERELELELEYARLLANSGDVTEALAYLDDMGERYGFVPELTRITAIISMGEDDQVSAWNNFNKLLSAGYYNNESNYYLAKMSETSRQYLDSLRYFSQVRSGPLLISAQIAIADILGQVGDLDAGIAHLDEVYAQFPRLGFDIWSAKGGLYARYWRSEDSFEAYNRSLEYQPDNINLMLARAAALDSMGDVDGAVAAFREALAIEPGNTDGMNSLGYTLANRNIQLREAEKLVAKALKQRPDSPAYLDSMGWVLYRQGKNEQALEYLERAYALNFDPEISAHLGEVLWRSGRRGEATIIWRLALQDSPQHMILRETIQRNTS